MKLENGKNWYYLDVENYNEDFLKEIIYDLHLKLHVAEEKLKELQMGDLTK